MIAWLLSPLAWLLLAGTLAVCSAFLHRGFGRWLRAACAVVAGIALVAMTPIVANALMTPLERSLPAPHWCHEAPPSIALVLAGGADGTPSDRADFSVLSLSSRRRVDTAVAWWRERDGRDLVLVGGSGHDDAPARAELMAAYARMLGVPPADLRVETDSIDTWSNAHGSAKLLPPSPRRIVLVTSAMHMPRAAVAFESAGFEICPMAGDYRRLPSRLPWALVPRTVGLMRTEAALHEWVGLAYYRLWLAADRVWRFGSLRPEHGDVPRSLGDQEIQQNRLVRDRHVEHVPQGYPGTRAAGDDAV